MTNVAIFQYRNSRAQLALSPEHIQKQEPTWHVVPGQALISYDFDTDYTFSLLPQVENIKYVQVQFVVSFFYRKKLLPIRLKCFLLD